MARGSSHPILRNNTGLESRSEDLLPDPPLDCSKCPRLTDFRHQNIANFPDFFNAPVPSFGDMAGTVMIVGLAPGLKGANATGRPFTGDYAGDLLYDCLEELGLTTGTYAKHKSDSLTLKGVLITNSVRCVPPQNKPTGPEINQCRPFLMNTFAAMPNLKTLFLLGRIAHDTTVRLLGLKAKDYPFGHGAVHTARFEGRQNLNLNLVDSYHCSRYNVNTGRLTKDMFISALKKAL